MVDYVYKKVDCKKSKREQYEKRSGHEAVTISGDTTIYISGDLAKAYGLQVNDRVDLYRLEKQGNDTNIFCFVKADKGDIKIRQKNKNGMATPKLTANTKDGVAYIREVTESRKFRAWISEGRILFAPLEEKKPKVEPKAEPKAEPKVEGGKTNVKPSFIFGKGNFFK